MQEHRPDDPRDTLTDGLRRGPPCQRARAAGRIGELGPDAAAWAVPALSSALLDDGAWVEEWSEELHVVGTLDQLRLAVAAALARMGPSGFEAFGHVLRAGGEGPCSAVARVLDSAAPADLGSLVPELRHALEHGARAVRGHALFALTRVEPRLPWLFDWLSAHLDDREHEVRNVVAHALRAYGSAALPLLRRMMEDSDCAVQSIAARSLAAAAPMEQALSELLAIVRSEPDPEFGRWTAAVDGLATLGPAAADALPLLEAAIQGAERPVQDDILDAIARISGQPRRFVDP
ncbi:HEAT repeat domain-containing protein [Nannocystis punicea]|uniref:HEAT repeat domain-containing protein n=1 Tax=Nannocystis punicea TaxID=2995304 RepID=A0ABY7GSS0_9BACT|nr:HEAT repeat domain-containing protein [Nannocystis poenicansa]WAS89999.1 HEAT repeat domain-containing protein [Nannocystis poenicansa]